MATVWINGTFIPSQQAALPLDDSGVTTGIGVFDTLRAEDGVLIHGLEHFARLIHDAQTIIRATPGYSEPQLEAITQDLLQKNGLDKGAARVRTTITGGVVHKPLGLSETPTVFMSANAISDSCPPINAWIITGYPRISGSVLENCKRLDYTRSYAARRDAEALGGNEALLTNTDGMIVCASTSNLFIVEGEQWFTPPLSDGVLDGITRRHVIADKNAKEESMLPERVIKADAIHISNSISGLRRITSLNGKEIA
jgi:branched-chain amino acid aminotransferase